MVAFDQDLIASAETEQFLPDALDALFEGRFGHPRARGLRAHHRRSGEENPKSEKRDPSPPSVEGLARIPGDHPRAPPNVPILNLP
jgi:hypothetical protein